MKIYWLLEKWLGYLFCDLHGRIILFRTFARSPRAPAQSHQSFEYQYDRKLRALGCVVS